jgi:hypothetical protein
MEVLARASSFVEISGESPRTARYAAPITISKENTK